MHLTAKTIQELVNVRAEIKSLTEKEADLTEKIKKTMKKKHLDEFAPVDSPYKFVRSTYDRSNVSWKDQWKKAVKKLKLKWKEELKRLQKRYTIEVESLNIEPNEEYKRRK